MSSSYPYVANDHDRALLTVLLKRGNKLPEISTVMKLSEAQLTNHYGDLLARYPRAPGRPFQPTEEHRKIVLLASSVGTPQEEIARYIGCSVTTLRVHFEEELHRGATSANLKVGGNLFQAATGPIDKMSTVNAAIWWSKSRMGWKEVSRVENTGADGKPIQVQNQVVVMLPDNGRGDSNLPPAKTIDGVLLDPPEIPAIEDDSLPEDADFVPLNADKS